MKRLFTLALTLTLNISLGYSQNAKDILIPRPNSVVMSAGSISLGKSISIDQTNAEQISKNLESELKEEFGIKVKNNSSERITLIVDTNTDITSEGYILDILADNIIIKSSTQAGMFYGVQSLIQLIRAGVNGKKNIISCQKIEDSPRFSWRSYMLDESRHFLGKKEVCRILDNLAALKLNVFHWHLTDDQGWRIEIKKYPKLTEIGSKRKDTQVGGWNSEDRAGVPYEGFYTQEDIKEILKYAKERHIKVVPEIGMPGHSTAAIASYPWLGTKNRQIEVGIEFKKHYDTYDVIDPRVIKFSEEVIAEVIELFDTDVIHIGGDEVRFNHWEEDADMIAHKKEKGFSSFMDIQIEFINKMSRFIETKGCSMMGWNEILGTNIHTDDSIHFDETSIKVAPNVVVQFWKGDLNALASAAKQGYRLVNSYHESTYMDYSFKRMPLEESYEFDPIPAGLEKEYHDNIIGFGTQMWCEWTPTASLVQRQTFPRIAAYSEVGWSNKDIKNYDSFLTRLKPIVEEWRTEGITVYSYEK